MNGDAVRLGLFSHPERFANFRVYRNLQGDMLWVAEDRNDLHRHFFESESGAKAWVESNAHRSERSVQLLTHLGYYEWRQESLV